MSDGDELDQLLAEVVVAPAVEEVPSPAASSPRAGPESTSAPRPTPASPAPARSSSTELSRDELEAVRSLVEVSGGMFLGLAARRVLVLHPAAAGDENYTARLVDQVNDLVVQRGLPPADWKQVELEEVGEPSGSGGRSVRSWLWTTFPVELWDPEYQFKWLSRWLLVWLAGALGVVVLWFASELLQLRSFPEPLLYSVLFLGVGVPLLEELLFRGVLYSAAEQVMGKAAAIGLVALVYPAVHSLYGPALGFDPLVGPGGLVVVAVGGVLWTYLRAMSRSIVPSVVFHVVHQVAFFGFGTLLGMGAGRAVALP